MAPLCCQAITLHAFSPFTLLVPLTAVLSLFFSQLPLPSPPSLCSANDLESIKSTDVSEKEKQNKNTLPQNLSITSIYLPVSE